MKTVSTLCATSTVGIAACGFALARPHHGDVNDRPTSLSPRDYDNPLRLVGAPVPREHQGENDDGPPSRPSAARRWLRRMSGSFSSSPSSSPSSLMSSSTVSTSRSRPRSWTAFQSGSRPPTRHKLLKRPPSQRRPSASTPGEPSSTCPSRPSTAVNQAASTREQHKRFSLSRVTRPSTSGQESTSLRLFDAPPKVTWHPFFPTKQHQKSEHSPTTRISRSSKIRRIFPDTLRGRRRGPALVDASAVNINSPDNDTGSICSDAGSAFLLSDAGMMYHMGEIATSSRSRPATSGPPSSPRASIRRSFSLSNFFGASPPRSFQYRDDDSGRTGICAMNVGFGRRYSSSAESTSSVYGRRQPPVTTPTVEEDRQLPTIRSLSVLDLQPESEVASACSRPDEVESFSPVNNLAAPASEIPNFRPNRLSLMSASERASTLIGSESEHEYGSETVFDSMRTRISELNPVRLEDIFDHQETPGKFELDDSRNEFIHPKPSPTDVYAPVFPPTSGTDDDDDGWSSDWDVPSKSADEEDHRLPGTGGLRPFSGLLSTPHLELNPRSNTSSTSFGTAPEGYSNDGSSTREANSILDWNDGVSNNATPNSSSYTRPKTVHAKESILVPTRAGRRAPTFHVRSQSVPVVHHALRGRLPLASENWDDDFLDNSDEEIGITVPQMVIPRAIEERQASVIGHLGYVREFALLVEDLKRLRLLALSKKIRDGPHRHLWDEADGIIALASLEDEMEDAPLRKDTLRRQNSWSPMYSEVHSSEERRQPANANLRSSVLLPDDDIFGGNQPITPVASLLAHSAHGSSVTPTQSPRTLVARSDPIEIAKGIMERMQQRQYAERLIAVEQAAPTKAGGKVYFDTDLLKELVLHVGHLKDTLAGLVDGISTTRSNPEKLPRLVTRMVDGSLVDKFEIDLSPVRSPLDDGFRNGMDMVSMEFTPVVGIASS